MSTSALPPDPETPAGSMMTLIGALFMLAWLGVAFVLGAMSLMACLMANDSGSASSNAHMAFIGGVMGGQVLAGLAGIPAGMAFFCKGRRKSLTLTSLAMLTVGGAVIAVSFSSFFP